MTCSIPAEPASEGLACALTAPRHGRATRLEHGFEIGIEEEYFLTCARTFAPPETTPECLFEGPDRRVQREMLQAQIEISTTPHADMRAARRELAQLRETAAQAASRHSLVILAAGTHPTATWPRMLPTAKDRYHAILDDLQMVGRRNMLCGLHVHVSIPDARSRVEIMNRIVPYVPVFLALSTSSPFWQGQNTGLKGYRLAAYDELPRTGLPEAFETDAQYDAYVDALERSGVIEDSSHIWWAVRPSTRYPTLELRAPDCCTRIDDALGVAALYRCLVRSICRLPVEQTAVLTPTSRGIAVENKWRAQRYGVQGTFVTESGAVPVSGLVAALVDFLQEDAAALKCLEELNHCNDIVRRGTSADEQLRIFDEALSSGCEEQALRSVANWLCTETLQF